MASERRENNAVHIHESLLLHNEVPSMDYTKFFFFTKVFGQLDTTFYRCNMRGGGGG